MSSTGKEKLRTEKKIKQKPELSIVVIQMENNQYLKEIIGL